MIFYKDSDVHITFEEQQKINKFARQNAKLEDYKEELRLKQVIQVILKVSKRLKSNHC